MTFCSVRLRAFFCALLLLVPTVCGGEIFLDYTNFSTRMSELATSAGIAQFSSGELATIRAGIKSRVESSFRGFDGFTFTETDPAGPNAVISFGLTAGAGSLGVADHIDFLNKAPNDTARVFSGNFGFIVDEFSGTNNRSEQISQLTAALAGTAAHEFGHNLGLRHHDAYGNQTFVGNPINTGGEQNGTLMATGSTGLSEVGRQAVREFSQHSLVKLAYAAGSLATNPTAILEAVDAGSTLATAFGLNLEDKIPSGLLTDRGFNGTRFAEVVVGTLQGASDIDVYELFLPTNFERSWSEITVDINNDYPSGTSFSNSNTFVELIDSLGNVIAADDVSQYSGNTFGSGSSGDGFDPAVFRVPVSTGERYFVRITAESGNGGDYQLLVHADGMMVPEPSTWAACCIGLIGVVACRRRRKQRSTDA
jgi:hypothetical protein